MSFIGNQLVYSEINAVGVVEKDDKGNNCINDLNMKIIFWLLLYYYILIIINTLKFYL